MIRQHLNRSVAAFSKGLQRIHVEEIDWGRLDDSGTGHRFEWELSDLHEWAIALW